MSSSLNVCSLPSISSFRRLSGAMGSVAETPISRSIALCGKTAGNRSLRFAHPAEELDRDDRVLADGLLLLSLSFRRVRALATKFPTIGSRDPLLLELCRDGGRSTSNRMRSPASAGANLSLKMLSCSDELIRLELQSDNVCSSPFRRASTPNPSRMSSDGMCDCIFSRYLSSAAIGLPDRLRSRRHRHDRRNPTSSKFCKLFLGQNRRLGAANARKWQRYAPTQAELL